LESFLSHSSKEDYPETNNNGDLTQFNKRTKYLDNEFVHHLSMVMKTNQEWKYYKKGSNDIRFNFSDGAKIGLGILMLDTVCVEALQNLFRLNKFYISKDIVFSTILDNTDNYRDLSTYLSGTSADKADSTLNLTYVGEDIPSIYINKSLASTRAGSASSSRDFAFSSRRKINDLY
jgi:hypothetical protein